MPKLKTHKSTQKRFKITGTGKVLRAKGHMNHLRRKKRPSTLRLVGRYLSVPTAERQRLERLLPYAAVKG